MRIFLAVFVVLMSFAIGGYGQTVTPVAATSHADVLVFANGDQLTGKLKSVTAGNVVFASDMAGELTISIDKIKELRSGGEFALLRKGDVVGKRNEPEGTVAVAGGDLVLTPSAGQPENVPVGAVNYLIDKATFDKEMGHQAGFRNGWVGTITGGADIERSTTTGTTLNAGLTLVRAIPTVAWMPARNRTSVDVAESYGRLSTPVIPPTNPATGPSVVSTNIFHADAERDEYFKPRLYALADVAFDHNLGQGLQLQQVYGGGVGWTALKSEVQELDFKADVHYEMQKFIATPGSTPRPSENLIGTTLFETYHRNLPRKLLFTETATVLPAWNKPSDYSANGMAALSVPVYKRFSATLTAMDNYLNDPATYYKKNSFQFITGVTYQLR